MDFPDQDVLPVLILRGPFRIVKTDRGGTVPEDGGRPAQPGEGRLADDGRGL